ncbi:MAG: EAL domain-containing protein, partial [Selenomonas sp.]|nr:EAL domain-containing protein [Selenomonas sp.]
IAEGVENQKQVDFLRLIGCEYAQGYFFSEPVPCEDYRELIKNDYVVERRESFYSETSGGTVFTLSSQLNQLMEELREIAPERVAAIEEKMKEEAAALW